MLAFALLTCSVVVQCGGVVSFLFCSCFRLPKDNKTIREQQVDLQLAAYIDAHFAFLMQLKCRPFFSFLPPPPPLGYCRRNVPFVVKGGQCVC
jgi:hypothetical protein